MPRLKASTWALGALLLAAVPSLAPRSADFRAGVQIGATARAHHVGSLKYRRHCIRSVCVQKRKFWLITSGCKLRGCVAYHFDKAAHDREHAKWAKDAACKTSRAAAHQEAIRQRKLTDGHAAEVKRLFPQVRQVLLADITAAQLGAAWIDSAAQAARAAAKTAAAQIGKTCSLRAQIDPQAKPAKAAADAAFKSAQQAVAAYRGASKARKVGPALDAYLKGMRGAALELMAATGEMAKRAPTALEAMGGFEGAPQQRFLRAVALIRYRTAQAYRLLWVARDFRHAAFTPKDAAGIDHLAALQGRKVFEQAEDLMASPVDPDREVDKELDNFSIRELGVGGEGKNPQSDPTNLEFPFDRGKAALAKFVIQAKRYLQATTATVLPQHQRHAQGMRNWFDRVAKAIKAAFKEVILSITAIENEQAGGDDDE